MRDFLPGARITHGPMDWQILQRRLDNKTDIHLAGVWKTSGGVAARVEVRVVDERWNRAVTAGLDWQYADTRGDGTWEATLASVPAGGPYRIETRLQPREDEWRQNGDRIHHVGVGDLWVIAGQSNAVGYGHGAVEDPPAEGVHLFRPSEVWSLADHPLDDPTRTRHPASFDGGWSDHSPWLAWGRVMRRELGIPVGLIPTALGGSHLRLWDPHSDNHPLYENMLAMVRAACGERDYTRFDPVDGGPVFLPPAHGEIGRIAGMLWYQGCSDTGLEEDFTSYAWRFSRFLESLRNALDAPALPVVTVQLNRCNECQNPQGWSEVREQQRRVSHDCPGVAIVPTLDLDLSDAIHLSPRANVVLGERAARAALGLAYGRDLLWKAPDIAGAGFENGQRERVMLYFHNVSTELWQRTPGIDQFVVEDDAGAVGIESAEIVKPDRVRLVLIRPLGDNPVVHGSPGHNPPVCILDRDHRPLLGFHGIPVQ